MTGDTADRDDLRLEQVLRDVLGARDPGPAPLGLRERVDRVPSETPPARHDRLHRAAPYLAVAAALVVLVAGIGALGAGRVGPGRVGTGSTGSAFDPYATGIGVVEAPSQVVVVLVVAALTMLAFYGAGMLRGRKSGVLAVLFVVIPGAFLVTQVLPAPRGTGGGTGPGMVPGEDLGYESGDRMVAVVTADPGEPYQLAFVASNPGPLPIRLDGIVPSPMPGVTEAPSLWVDGMSPDGFSAPASPFAPVILGPGEEVVLWLVQRASSCAIGSEQQLVTASGGADQSAISLRWSVLGLVPRTDGIELAYYVTTPFRAGCSIAP
jgi:hypothetical protein